MKKHKKEDLERAHVELQVIEESGNRTAIIGLSTNMNQTLEHTLKVADRMATKKKLNSGELKFFESLKISFILRMPDYVWPEFDTYRVGVSKQSQSEMHTLHKRQFNEDDFEWKIPPLTLHTLNQLQWQYKNNMTTENLMLLRAFMPKSHLTTRVISTNLKTLCHIYRQRKGHRLPHWERIFRRLEDEYTLFNWVKQEPLDDYTFNEFKKQITGWEVYELYMKPLILQPENGKWIA